MKRGFYILMIMCTVLLTVSCNKTKSYTEYLKAERKAIERLMDNEGFDVLKNYPSDGVFKENEYVKLDNDVYLNVIDSGNGERATPGTTRVFCRFIANDIMDADTAQLMVDNLSPRFNNRWGFPTEFIFGYNVSAAERAAGSYDPDYFVGEGLATALHHVGNGATVKLIVPFKRTSSFLQSSYKPVYFSKVKYTFQE